jgi:hypothetical protein
MALTGICPYSITDHISHQNTRYCDELGDRVSIKTRELGEYWLRGEK